MKPFKFILLIFFFIGCKKNSPAEINEVPIQLIQTSTCASLYSTFLELLPSGQNNKANRSYFFNDTVRKEVLIKSDTKVYLTFINENANALNTIGWYTYNVTKAPNKKSDIQMHVLFPNAKLIGSGGELKAGDMMQLDSVMFTTGSVIGFFLVVNGWKNGRIDYSQPILFTDYLFNHNQDQQHVLYNDTACNVIVLSFEDTPLNLKSDSDYNDLIFTVSDNKIGLATKSFDLKGMVVK